MESERHNTSSDIRGNNPDQQMSVVTDILFEIFGIERNNSGGSNFDDITVNKYHGKSSESDTHAKSKQNGESGIQQMLPEECTHEETYGEMKRKSKYSKIYAAGDISFVRQYPIRNRQNNGIAIQSTIPPTLFAGREGDVSKREVDETERNYTGRDEVGCDTKDVIKSLSQNEKNEIFVHKLMNILKYPRNKQHQDSALTILRLDKELLQIFLKEKQKLGKQTIPVFTKQSVVSDRCVANYIGEVIQQSIEEPSTHFF